MCEPRDLDRGRLACVDDRIVLDVFTIGNRLERDKSYKDDPTCVSMYHAPENESTRLKDLCEGWKGDRERMGQY